MRTCIITTLHHKCCTRLSKYLNVFFLWGCSSSISMAVWTKMESYGQTVHCHWHRNTTRHVQLITCVALPLNQDWTCGSNTPHWLPIGAWLPHDIMRCSSEDWLYVSLSLEPYVAYCMMFLCCPKPIELQCIKQDVHDTVSHNSQECERCFHIPNRALYYSTIVGCF